MRTIVLILFALVLGSTPVFAERARATVVPLTTPNDADAETRALADTLSRELRRLVVGRFGGYRLAVADADAKLVAKLPDCRPLVTCLVAIGANADRVIHGGVRRKAPGFHVRLVLVDVTKRRYARVVDAVMWEDTNDVTTLRAWVRKHYAKLLGARGARSS